MTLSWSMPIPLKMPESFGVGTMSDLNQLTEDPGNPRPMAFVDPDFEPPSATVLTTNAAADLRFHEQLVASVESTRFHPDNPPPEEPWAFKLAGVEVAHCGNIITVAAAVKSGKSSVISAMMASMMSSIGQDYLGFEGSNPGGKAVLHYDTEQSRGDHYHMMMRALRRADLQTPPSWFSSFSLTLLILRNVVQP